MSTEGLKTGVGGYFSLELAKGDGRVPAGHRLQSARAGLRLLVEQLGARRVLMPGYICNELVSAARDAGAVTQFYELNADLLPSIGNRPDPDDLFLVCNYFGVCTNLLEWLESLDSGLRERVVLDYSQAWFEPRAECLATLYSPRKFFGVPDGGILATDLALELPSEYDDGSRNRMRHLVERLDGRREAGRSAYTLAEQSLADTAPRRMSRLTSAVLDSIHARNAAQRRRRNFARLNAELGALNQLKLEAGVGPMCYPYLPPSDVHIDRCSLAAHGIFVPRYWDGISGRLRNGSLEEALVERMLALPCDHRYGEQDMAVVAMLVRGVSR